ncbi:MAG: DUF3459 domain-containing protein, partial [Anaerolineae bacterium]
FYRRILRLRRETPALVEGDYVPLDTSAEDYLAYLRRTDGQACLVVLNFSGRRLTLRATGEARVLLSSRAGGESAAPAGVLRAGTELAVLPYEAAVLEWGGGAPRIRPAQQ